MSSLNRNFLICAGGAILSFALIFSGRWVTVQVIIRNHYFGTNNKDQLIWFSLIQALALFPIVAVTIGIFVGYFVQKAVWWLVGLSLLPLLIYDLVKGEGYGGEIILNIIYLLLGLISAFGISRLQRRHVQSQRHV